MYSFMNDYSQTAHPNIINAISRSRSEQNAGYGSDMHCERAKQLLVKCMENASVEIHFLPGGTITNLTMISHVLRSFHGVITADTGHINVHETGAIEATGHKVIPVETSDGKLTPDGIEPVLEWHANEHYVKPAMVYISNPTELGTVYSKSELENLYQYCKEQNLLFFMDGARLAMALAIPESDVTLKDLPKLTDAFYIGGTKAGAMFGEALVIVKDTLKKDMRYNMKQHGALLAKGWLLGIQFEELFEDNLYLKNGEHSNAMADILRKVFRESGFTFLSDSYTNQVFPILPNNLIDQINQNYRIAPERIMDAGHTCVRFCTSWATREEDVLAFVADFKKMLGRISG